MQICTSCYVHIWLYHAVWTLPCQNIHTHMHRIQLIENPIHTDTCTYMQINPCAYQICTVHMRYAHGCMLCISIVICVCIDFTYIPHKAVHMLYVCRAHMHMQDHWWFSIYVQGGLHINSATSTKRWPQVIFHDMTRILLTSDHNLKNFQNQWNLKCCRLSSAVVQAICTDDDEESDTTIEPAQTVQERQRWRQAR